jgi:hypothetical protein
MSEPNTALHQEFCNTEGGLYLSYENANGAKIAAALRRVFPNHGVNYAQSIELLMTGPLAGGIKCETPGVFEIACGELPAGKTGKYQGVGGVWSAENGDIVLAAPNGSIKLLAQNIEILSNGDQKETGHVSVFANGKFRTHSNRVEIDADTDIQIVAPVEVNITGTELVHIEAGTYKVEEGSDTKGDPTGGSSASIAPGTKTRPQWARQIIRFFKNFTG